MAARWIQVAFAVAGAAVPLAGVISGRWSLREVVVLYWAENLVIGALQIVKMLAASPRGVPPGAHFIKVFMVPFFTVHYGLFCLVHGVFVFALTGGAFDGGDAPSPGEIPAIMAGFPRPFWLALALIVGGRTWDMVNGYFLSGRWREEAGLQELMGEPYKHIVVVHIGILLGAFLSIALGNPIGVLLIIVIGKLLIDLREIRGKGAAGDRKAGEDAQVRDEDAQIRDEAGAVTGRGRAGRRRSGGRGSRTSRG